MLCVLAVEPRLKLESSLSSGSNQKLLVLVIINNGANCESLTG